MPVNASRLFLFKCGSTSYLLRLSQSEICVHQGPQKWKKKKVVPFLSPLHFSTPATQPTENIYLKIALKYVQTIRDAPARQLLKADFMDTYGYEPVYMMCLKLACSFGLRCHNTSS